ncbi:MAG: PD-(D/E)XK nuclease family protein, partial [Planctomycetota bacterium]
WQALTPELLARRLATRALAAAGLVPVSGVAVTAIAVRVLARLRRQDRLGRYDDIADKPGFAPSLARTFDELGMADIGADTIAEHDAELAGIYWAYLAEIADLQLADRPAVFAMARDAAVAGTHELVGLPVILADVPIRSMREGAVLRTLIAQAPTALVTIAAGDKQTESALAVTGECYEAAPTNALERAQCHLFGPPPAPTAPDSTITVFSAPGENRECVEIARRVLAEARDGTPFDRMAVLLRAPLLYRPHLVEAFRRAGIPAHFSGGTVRPDPSGRAFLTLLDCAHEGLSARAFAEYLSLSVVPADGEHVRDDFVAPPDFPLAAVLPSPEAGDKAVVADADAPIIEGALRVPRRWERLLVNASVIGGLDRWRRRLAGLRAELQRAIDLEDPESPRGERLRRNLGDLTALCDYAVPILEMLAALPEQATWGQWLPTLTDLARASLREPFRVLEVLAELEPMAPVGPVDLSEVRHVLGERLGELVDRPEGQRAGKVFVGGIDEARGLEFDTVFVPGLAERLFPHKVIEDSILLDRVRATIGPALATNTTRVAEERMALRIAVGAANARLVLSYPRLDSEQ